MFPSQILFRDECLTLQNPSFALLFSTPGKEVPADTVNSCFARRGDARVFSLLYPQCNAVILMIKHVSFMGKGEKYTKNRLQVSQRRKKYSFKLLPRSDKRFYTLGSNSIFLPCAKYLNLEVKNGCLQGTSTKDCSNARVS